MHCGMLTGPAFTVIYPKIHEMVYELKHKTNRQISLGRYYPLSATLSEKGVNFAIYSQYSGEIFLLLFDRPDSEPTDIIRLENRTNYIWHQSCPN